MFTANQSNVFVELTHHGKMLLTVCTMT